MEKYGLTLCGACHRRLHLKIRGWNKGRHHSEETRRKISESSKGRKISPEHLKKAIAGSTGRKHTEEELAKMRGPRPWTIGKKMSPEACRKMSVAKKGKPTWNKGIKMNPEQRKNMGRPIK